VEKYLCAIGVIVDDEPVKDYKDTGNRSQTIWSKVNEKKAIGIDNLTHLLKSLTTKVSELKQRTTETAESNKPPRFVQRKNVASGNGSSHPTKYAQCYVRNGPNCKGSLLRDPRRLTFIEVLSRMESSYEHYGFKVG